MTSRSVAYYWEIVSLISDHNHCIMCHEISDIDMFDLSGLIELKLIFSDNAKLVANFIIRFNDRPHEYDYYYGFYDSSGQRLFYYDDARHHPEISTHPNHLHRRKSLSEDSYRVCAIDIPEVSFRNILNKIIARYETE